MQKLSSLGLDNHKTKDTIADFKHSLKDTNRELCKELLSAIVPLLQIGADGGAQDS